MTAVQHSRFPNGRRAGFALQVPEEPNLGSHQTHAAPVPAATSANLVNCARLAAVAQSISSLSCPTLHETVARYGEYSNDELVQSLAQVRTFLSKSATLEITNLTADLRVPIDNFIRMLLSLCLTSLGMTRTSCPSEAEVCAARNSTVVRTNKTENNSKPTTRN